MMDMQEPNGTRHSWRCCGVLKHGAYCDECGKPRPEYTATSDAEMLVEHWSADIAGCLKAAATCRDKAKDGNWLQLIANSQNYEAKARRLSVWVNIVEALIADTKAQRKREKRTRHQTPDVDA